MLLKCFTQYTTKFRKLRNGHRTGNVSFHSNPKKGNAKECSNYRTIALTSHASKAMLKILQERLQQYMNKELQFSRTVMSHSLRRHESQHARPPCPSPSPRVHSDSHQERQCQITFKLPHNCTNFTHLQSNAQNSQSQASTVHEL